MNEIGKSKKSREVERVVVTLTDEDLAEVKRLTASRDREPKKSERITDEEPLSDGFGRANFRLMLRDSKTWNHLASNLEPEVPELRLKVPGLRILSHYPYGLKFTAAR